MTAIAPPGPVHAKQGQLLLTTLQEIHDPWLQQTRQRLDAARRSEAGIRCRWNAIQYLNTTVRHRFELERAAVEGLGGIIAPVHAAQLWLAAELLGALHWRLDRELGLCHRPNDFSVLTHKFEKAMVHWRQAVEDALGSLNGDEIQGEAHRRFAHLGAEEVHRDL